MNTHIKVIENKMKKVLPASKREKRTKTQRDTIEKILSSLSVLLRKNAGRQPMPKQKRAALQVAEDSTLTQ